MTGLVERFTFFAGCLPRTPFRELVSGAASAGFDSISIWPNIWRHAMRKDGLTLREMRAMLDDHGLVLTDVDGYRDWAPLPTSDSLDFGPSKSGIPLDEWLDTCAALGGSTIVAVHLTDVPLDLDRDADSFARLCDRAAAYGLRVGLEFVAFGQVPDVATAMRIVERAGRPNAGFVVDLWHHARSSFDNEALAKLPGDRIYTVQFSDGPLRSPFGLVEEAMFHRQWPSEGEFGVTEFLRLLDGTGARASVGAELYHSSFQQRDPAEVINEIAERSRAAIIAAGLSLP